VQYSQRVPCHGGHAAARHIHAFLQGGPWPEPGLPLTAEPPLAWVCPNVIVPGALARPFRFRARQFANHARLEVHQGARLLHTPVVRRLIVNESMSLAGDWVRSVQAGGGPVTLTVVQ
jgi:hypothetical protein